MFPRQFSLDFSQLLGRLDSSKAEPLNYIDGNLHADIDDGEGDLHDDIDNG